MSDQFVIAKVFVGALATLGLYSVLYRETKIYRLFEHIFIGLGVGWSMVALWTETLKPQWWDRMVGVVGEKGAPDTRGYYLYAVLLPLGLLGYLVFSKKHNWMSRIPIGIILGLWSGQQVRNFWTEFGPQIETSAQPLIPTTFSSLFVPSERGMSPQVAAEVASHTYLSEALSNAVFTFTLIAVLSYFLFSFDIKNKAVLGLTRAGRLLMMVGFGAIFGSTVMGRFALMIDRMYFIWIEFLVDGFKKLTGG